MTFLSEHRKIHVPLPLLSLSGRPPSFPVTSSTTKTTSTAASSVVLNNVSISDIEIVDRLGRGNGGVVYKVRHTPTSGIYAMKLIKCDTNPVFTKQLRREIEILSRIDSPYIVQCHKIFEKPFVGEVLILMEYMDHGTLKSLSGTVTEQQLAGFSFHILKGLSYLHSLKIVHRDIKPANLLLNSKNEVKIADFGVSKIMNQSPDRINSCIGTYAYMSPERLNSKVADSDDEFYAGDIWSFGLMMLELLIGHLPFVFPTNILNWTTLMCAVCFEEPPKAPERCSSEFQSFIDCCLRKNPSERWTASQLLNHPFLRKFF